MLIDISSINKAFIIVVIIIIIIIIIKALKGLQLGRGGGYRTTANGIIQLLAPTCLLPKRQQRHGFESPWKKWETFSEQ